MYALIRSESFFNADVMSSAGAIGLTQLMEFTGSDIARRFKMQDYSLTDPETNINFGTYYLSSLISRCDNSSLLGFFSYNAGITRVRRWLQSSLIEFGKKSNMPLDLFLETIPFAETREYGRKLVSATIAYDWLNDPHNFPQTVENLIEQSVFFYYLINRFGLPRPYIGVNMIEDPKLLETVKEALEMFRPQLQADGGDMEFVCIDDDYKVHLNLTGACGGCPMAVMTLKMGIERYLIDACPEIKEVVQDNAQNLDEMGMGF